MKKTLVALLVMLATAAGSTLAGATTIDRAGFTKSFGTGTVINDTLTGSATGMGSITVKYASGNNYSSGLFVDYEINQTAENTGEWYDEYGVTYGSLPLAANLTWEIDEPKIGYGDISTNFAGNTLDSTNSIPLGSDPFGGDGILGDDVAMALMWKNFTVAAGMFREITFTVGTERTNDPYTLAQYDNFDSTAAIFFSSDYKDFPDDPTTVPEPSTILLLGAGLAGLGLYGRRRSKK